MDILLLLMRYGAVAVFVVAMIWAAVSDARTFEVSNLVSIAVVLAFPLMALGSGMGWDAVLNRAVTAGCVLAVGFGLYIVRVMGAGDVKLLAAVALWTGWPGLVPYLFWVALCGGVLAVFLIVFRRRPLPDALSGVGWVRRIHARGKDVPYAIAVALPAAVLVPLSVLA